MGRQLRVLDRVLNALVPKEILDRPSIDSLVGQGEPTRVTQHVRVHREPKIREPPCPLHELIDPGARQRTTTLGREEEWAGAGYSRRSRRRARISSPSR